MDVLMKTAVFEPSDPISVFSFLDSFKPTCDSNNIHEGTAMWLLLHFIDEPAKAALSYPSDT